MALIHYLEVLLAISILNIGYVIANCPDGFLVHKDSCYKEFGIKATWAEASMVCQVYGGYLANIDNQQEQLYVASYLSRLGADSFTPGRFWLGGTDIQIEGLWEWSRGKDAFTYTNWQSGTPDNANGKENCLDFEFTTNFKWNDNDCQIRQNFLCEIPAVQSQEIIG